MAKEIKKKDQSAVVKLIRKSNNLVEAKYKFDIWETRVFTKMLSMIRPDDADFKEYRIYLSEIIHEYDLKTNKDAYEWLKHGARKLTKKTIKLIRSTEEGLTEFYAPIAVGVENPLDPSAGEGDMAYIDISFHPKIRPELLALQSQFTIYDVRNVLKLPSTYSIRIYELLKQYERIGSRKFTLSALKEIIGAKEEFEVGKKIIMKDHYPLYGNFRQRVLLKAQKDLERFTDISFTFEPIKRGRKVHEIKFFIFPDTKNKTGINGESEAGKTGSEISPLPPAPVREANNLFSETENSTFTELYPQVKDWMGEQAFRKLLQDYPLTQVKNSINYTRNRLKKGEEITNVAGYIITLAKQGNITDPTEKKRALLDRKKKANEAAAKAKADLLMKLNKLKKELYNLEINAIEQFLTDNKADRDKALITARSKPVSRYDLGKTDDENFAENHFFRMSVISAVKDLFPEVTAETGQELKPEIERCEQELLKL